MPVSQYCLARAHGGCVPGCFGIILTLLACVGGALIPAGVQAEEEPPGFGLSTTRVVVMAGAKGGTPAEVQNNTDNVYLVQSRVYPAQGVSGYPRTTGSGDDEQTPFLVVPPLKRMGPRSHLPLRLLVTPKNTLPRDRESLFFLGAKAIPSVSPENGGGKPGQGSLGNDAVVTSSRMVMALQQVIKLFYRPAGLKPSAISDGDVASRLTMSLSGGRLHVSNPTPYYITFGSLMVNGKPVDAVETRTLTPPLGGQDYRLPTGVTGGTVEWQVIDEDGYFTKKQTQTLHAERPTKQTESKNTDRVKK